MSYGASYYSSSVDGGIVAMIMGIIGIAFVIWLIAAIIMIVSKWIIFGKAGEKGWKAIIPFYNDYILYKIVWDTRFFFISLGLVLGMSVCSVGSSYSEIFTLLYYACLIAGAVIGIMCQHKLSQSFGHGAGFTVGLVLLGIIFYPILAFGRSMYLGNASK